MTRSHHHQKSYAVVFKRAESPKTSYEERRAEGVVKRTVYFVETTDNPRPYGVEAFKPD